MNHTAGPKAAGKNALIGGLVLAMIEGASIAITKVRPVPVYTLHMFEALGPT